MENLINKYNNYLRSQELLRIKTPLTDCCQINLLDQNIHLFEMIIRDLKALARNAKQETESCNIHDVSVFVAFSWLGRS